MKKLIFVVSLFCTIHLNADILDDAINYWYVEEDYKNTETFIYWSKKYQNTAKNYIDYKKENPYRAIAIESLLETGAIAVSIVGVFEVGTANGISYIIKNYNTIATPNTILKSNSIPKARMTNYEKNIVNTGKKIKYVNTRVIQRDSIFHHSAQNLVRMKNGQPPIGIDNEPVQLHHMKQQNHGVLIEILANDEHRKEYKRLHRYKDESEIDRSKFNAFRNSYWKERAKRIENSETLQN